MYRGHVKGLLAFGMNGVAIGPNSQKNIDALKKADWLVVCEIYPDETSEFWKSPGITAEEMKQIQTTVYRLPGAGFAEKDGTFVNSARWLQWKSAALPPPGMAKLDQEILARIFLKVRELYKKEGGKFPDPVLNATWSYTDPHNPSLSEIAKEINGRALADVTDPKLNQTIKAGQQLPGFAWLRDDGSTMCGNWLYCGSWTEAGAHDAAARHGGSVGLGHLSELGLVVASQPARAVQPRLLRSGGRSVGPGPQAGLVERSAAELGGPRRAGLQSGLPAQGPHGAVHHELRRRRAAVCAAGGLGRRAISGALRAGRKPGGESAASRPIDEPHRQEIPFGHG